MSKTEAMPVIQQLILATLRRTPYGASVHDLAEHLETTVSRLYRHLRPLQDHGWVIKRVAHGEAGSSGGNGKSVDYQLNPLLLPAAWRVGMFVPRPGSRPAIELLHGCVMVGNREMPTDPFIRINVVGRQRHGHDSYYSRLLVATNQWRAVHERQDDASLRLYRAADLVVIGLYDLWARRFAPTHPAWQDLLATWCKSVPMDLDPAAPIGRVEALPKPDPLPVSWAPYRPWVARRQRRVYHANLKLSWPETYRWWPGNRPQQEPQRKGYAAQSRVEETTDACFLDAPEPTP